MSRTCLGTGTSDAIVVYCGSTTLEAAVLNPRLLKFRSFVFLPVRLPPFSVEIEQHWQQQCADCEPVHAVVWDAGVALCDWLCEAGREAVALGSSIIELGSGTGLVSIVAARLGAQRVVATDLEPALLLLGRNVWQQGSADRCAVRRCMWGDKADIHQIREEQRRTIPGSDGKFDVVLGSDLTYKETNDAAAALLGTICEFLAPGATAYVSFKFRANPDDVTLVHLAQAKNLEVHEEPLTLRRGVVGCVRLLKIRRREGASTTLPAGTTRPSP